VTLDISAQAADMGAIVPAGLVSLRVNQLEGPRESTEANVEEFIKKQKRMDSTKIARSMAAAGDSPRRAQ
jgi:rare lipoprotein A (peptidoglycan hydrolase)